MQKSKVDVVYSEQGSAIGVDILTDTSNAKVKQLNVDSVIAGFESPAPGEGPNEMPVAKGIHVSADAEEVALRNICAGLIAGIGGEMVLHDESDAAFLKEMCK